MIFVNLANLVPWNSVIVEYGVEAENSARVTRALVKKSRIQIKRCSQAVSFEYFNKSFILLDSVVVAEGYSFIFHFFLWNKAYCYQ